VQKYTTLTICS